MNKDTANQHIQQLEDSVNQIDDLINRRDFSSHALQQMRDVLVSLSQEIQLIKQAFQR